MSDFTMPSGHGHQRDRFFKSSVLISFVIHALIIAVAGTMTLFKMSGTNYAPSYTVDLVTLPAPRPAPVKSPAAEVKQAPKEVKPKPEPKPQPPPEKKTSKPAAAPPPPETVREFKPSGGDEAAQAERRKKIEELQREAQRLYESFTAEEPAPAPESLQPAEIPAASESGAKSPGGGTNAPNDIRFRVYYDRIWAKIRSSWVLPEGVTAKTSLLTVVSIRIAADGKIEEAWIEKKSGNEYYDQSALRAIRKANPLPPLPEGVSGSTLEVGINFRYPE